MNNYTHDDILHFVKDLKIAFIRLQFSDILGITKNVAIPVPQLQKALEGELAFDGSSIEGFVRIEESDMHLKPDPNSFCAFPWRKGEGATARLICDVYNPDDTPFTGCPRNTLQRAIRKAADLGLDMYAGPELEFFLFLQDENGEPTTVSHDQGGYFDLTPVDKGENARRDIVINLQKMGFEIETSHHEVAPGQHEISFKYADALNTADNIATFRFVVRTIAMAHNLHATFMPKPVYGINGSGMHTHLSLFQGDNNIFYDPESTNQLSSKAYNFIGGLMEHVKGFTAITNPIVNSYKRLVPGYEAPVYNAWSERNRSPLIRIPARRGVGTRVELRSPDPACNPYLAMAVMLRAGIDGIERDLSPPDPVDFNIYELSEKERIKRGIDILPINLGMALKELKNDELIKEALGEHIFNRFYDAKTIEWNNYRSQVHAWETNQYLKVF